MWFWQCVLYQIYPLGFCGAPEQNDGEETNRIQKILDWIGHIQGMGADTIYFCPVFESDRHGYDTRDYTKLDCRLGSNADFASVCDALHKAGMRIVLDGVFHHVGRGFWAFRDVLQNRENSRYRDWFYLNFSGNSSYNDGLWYEGWEGHYDLVKLNLQNPDVAEYLLQCVKGWIEQWGIDGLRLDVAYMLDGNFMRRLRNETKALREDFFLVGEAVHGDYNRIVNAEMLDSCTNYECYKGIYSSFNDHNLFEIGHSLNRQFGPEHWTLYKGKHLVNFVDNHDVTRFASRLRNPNHLKAAYALLFGMPGIPSVYYGSEWAAEGEKTPGDDSPIRPCYDRPQKNELTAFIGTLARICKARGELCYGQYQPLYLTSRQFAFVRKWEGKACIVAVNASDMKAEIRLPQEFTRLVDLFTGETVTADGSLSLPAYGAAFWADTRGETREL